MSPELLELQAFVDGELELARQLALEERLQADAALRAEVERLRALRRRMREEVSYHAAPAALQERLRGALQDAAPADERSVTPAPQPSAVAPRKSTATLPRARWWPWPVLAPTLALAAALLVAVPAWLAPEREQERVEHDVLASHARAVLAQHLVDVASSDHHTVKPWLSARLDFSPPVDPPPGSELLGARVDYVDGHPAATLVLRHAGHTVDHFVWPVRAGDAAPAIAHERGFQLAHWTRGGMRHWLVSDLNEQEFAQLVATLQAQP